LAKRARNLLRWKIRFNAVQVVVVGGHVTLSGKVTSYLDRETAEQTIRRLSGVVEVTNHVVTDPPHSRRQTE
jgi:osmotically-inducible protein OsmY